MSYNCACGYSSPATGGSAGYGQHTSQYSALESAVAEHSEYSPAMRMSEERPAQQMEMTGQSEMTSQSEYTPKKNQTYSEGTYLSSKSSRNYYFTPEIFLKDIPTEFISCSDEQQKQLVKALVEEAFEATTGKLIPGDIAIRICSEQKLRKIHESNKGVWRNGVKGFSINKRGFGLSEIFVKEDELARLMLTIGHEIGHVISLPMKEAVDEEAKAFAFSMAWMKAIKDNNIGSLSAVINPMPAKNGLHNVAFDFVVELMEKGRKAIDVYLDLIKGEVSINNAIPSY